MRIDSKIRMDNKTKMDNKTRDNMSNLYKPVFGHLLFTVFCAVFGGIYEVFSHEVYSFYMIYAFLIPLVLGVGALMLIMMYGKKKPNEWSLRFWNLGIIALTVGCIFKGVLEIFGTTNRLVIVYPVAAAILLSLGMGGYFLNKKEKVSLVSEGTMDNWYESGI